MIVIIMCFCARGTYGSASPLEHADGGAYYKPNGDGFFPAMSVAPSNSQQVPPDATEAQKLPDATEATVPISPISPEADEALKPPDADRTSTPVSPDANEAQKPPDATETTPAMSPDATEALKPPDANETAMALSPSAPSPSTALVPHQPPLHLQQPPRQQQQPETSIYSPLDAARVEAISTPIGTNVTA